MHDNGTRQFESGELEVPLSETQELELASELLEVSSEQELEQFLGDVFHGVGNALGQFVRSDTAQALGGILKGAAAKALPVVGRAIGERLAPGRGGEWGGQLAQAAGTMLGLELEGLSPQDQEFEAARQFVRLAGAAANQALLAPPRSSPDKTARRAAAAAAERFAPGLAQEIGHGRRRPMRGGYGGGGAERRYPAAGSYGRPGPYGRRAPYRTPASYPPRSAGYGSRNGGGGRFGTRSATPTGRRRGQWRPGAATYGERWRAPVGVRAGVSGPSYGGAGQRPWQQGGQRAGQPGYQPYRYGGAGQRRWQQGWRRAGQPGYQPYRHGGAGQRPWQQGWQRPWQAGYRPYQYGAEPSDDGGGFYGAQPWGGQASPVGVASLIQIEGSSDWSQPLRFYGRTPPPAPPGAPGRWVYVGLGRRGRLWRWIPFPGATQFWAATPDAYAGAPSPDAPGEPEPPPPGPNGAAPIGPPGPWPTFEPAQVAASPANGAAQSDAHGQAMGPGPGEPSQQNGIAPTAPQGT
jgi:hypothetical protein